MADLRALVRSAGKPPTISRPCSGTRLRAGYWTDRRDAEGHKVRRANGGVHEYERVWVEATEEPCGSGASAWVPEVAYCAHHLPFALMAIANERAELWARLNADIWAQVLAEYPIEAP